MMVGPVERNMKAAEGLAAGAVQVAEGFVAELEPIDGDKQRPVARASSAHLQPRVSVLYASTAWSSAYCRGIVSATFGFIHSNPLVVCNSQLESEISS